MNDMNQTPIPASDNLLVPLGFYEQLIIASYQLDLIRTAYNSEKLNIYRDEILDLILNHDNGIA